MNSKSFKSISTVVGIIVVVAGLVWVITISSRSGPAIEPSGPGSNNGSDAAGTDLATELRPVPRMTEAERAEAELRAREAEDYGISPVVDPNANPNTRSVSEAYREKKHPERLTHAILPAKFDATTFAANPQAYLDVVEPGRVYQPAQPGPGVPRIGRVTDYFQVVAQGKSVKLAVKAVPGAPVSFNSFDLGAFENQLTSITVLANEQGIAEVSFTGTTGTIEDVNIMAASPMTSGQVRFVVNVQLN